MISISTSNLAYRVGVREILAGVTAKQKVQLLPSPAGLPDTVEEFVIPDHTLYGSYPPKIAEAEVKETLSSGGKKAAGGDGVSRIQSGIALPS